MFIYFKTHQPNETKFTQTVAAAAGARINHLSVYNKRIYWPRF